MVGIVSCGVHLPYYRLARSDIARAWAAAPGQGERTVAAYDEDSLTMAVSAGMDCLRGRATGKISALHFASTSSPYVEKQAAATAALALDLTSHTFTTDFGNSLRAGTSAMKVACDTVGASPGAAALVCAADVRPCHPSSDKEMSFGDAGAALLLGGGDVLAEVEGWHWISDEIIDVWRRDGDRYVRSWEDRFVLDMGFSRVVEQAVTEFLARLKLKASDVWKIVLPCPSPRQASISATKLGFSPGQFQDTFFDKVGYTGVAAPLIGLIAALQDAKPGQRILVVSYGSGCDVLLLRATGLAGAPDGRSSLSRQLGIRRSGPLYSRWLHWRKAVEIQPPARPDPEKASAVALWLDNQGGIAMYGSQCRVCGTRQYPMQRVCVKCGAKDSSDPYRFADKTGRLTTFCQDNLAVSLDPPTTVAVVDFLEGGRFVGDMTDCEPGEAQVDMTVEMTFRKISDAGGLNNYWWKARPKRY